MSTYKMFINGEFVEAKSKKTRQIINPCNSKAFAWVAEAGLADLELAISSARKAFEEGSWPSMAVENRAGFLLKIAKGIRENAGKLAELESLNSGKPIKETTFMDIPSAAQVFEDVAKLGQEWLRQEDLKLPAEAKSTLLREPIGVVGLIVPWNYPLLIASWKLASSLMSGNAVILKPSSLTPLSMLELTRIISEIGLPKGILNVITGPGSEIGAEMASSSKIDMVSFTGSNEVGKEIMALASSNTKKILMELGGKSAAIVLEDADIEVVSSSLLCAVFLNQGQMCTAMSRLLISKKIYDKFLETFIKKASAIKLGDSLNYETQMGPLISDGERHKVISFVVKAKSDGAKILLGGKIPEDSKDGFFFEPTVLSDVKEQMQIFQDEVFGPVAVVSCFSTPDEAIALANNSKYGLASSIWTKDLAKAKELAEKINAGTVWINTYGMFYTQAPYGGFKESGFGKELGREGFLEYTRLKHINTDLSKDNKPLVSYWYGF